jgi:signal transduction histidine kinase
MKKSILLALLLVPAFGIVAAQQIIIDSLKRELRTAKEDTARVLLLGELARSLYLSKPDTALLLAQQGYDLSQKLHYPRGIALALNRMAVGHSALGDYPKSLLLFKKALAASQELNDPVGTAQAYNNIGDTYLIQMDYTNALAYFIKANKTITPGAKPYAEMIFSLNIGECYLRMQQYDSALFYLQTTYGQVKKYGFDDLYGDFERNLGEVEAAKNHVPAALAYLRQSVASSQAVEDLQNVSKTYKSIGAVYRNQQQPDSAIFYTRKALAAAQAGSYNQGIFETSTLLTQLYEGKNDAVAFRYLKLATAAKDSLFSQEKVKQLLSISFEEKQRQQELEAARAESRNQIRLYALLGILGVFLLLALVLYRNNRQKQKANMLLQQQKQEIENTLAELKATQAQLVQSEKMASLGALAAGIAHEIQNPLNFVNNFSEVSAELAGEVKQAVEDGNREEALIAATDIQDNLKKIAHHGKRADAIVKGMLQHSRKNTGEKQLTDINTLADEYLRLSYHGLRAKDKSFNADFKTALDKTIGKISIVPQDIGRVLMNLFNNAFYAVHEKKKNSGEGYEPTIFVSTKKLADTIEIRVQDNGMGISKSLIDKIFQPFFTTKPTGQGTGLGLSLSYDIIIAHGGELKVDTEEGKGATFTILLPA